MALRPLAALAAILTSLSGARSSVQQPTFKSGVEVVRVDALVTRDGVAVTGLRAADFEVIDTGVRQTIDHILPAEEPIDVIMALDTSGSLDSPELVQLMAAVRAALDSLRPGDRAGLIAFSEELHELVPLTDQVDRARGALDRLESSGATSLVDVTYAALLSARVEGRRSLALLFTDGMDTWSWLEPRWVLDVARRSEAVVYTVGLRDATLTAYTVPGYGFGVRMSPNDYQNAATRFLSQITDTTGGRRLDAENIAHVQRTLQTVLEEFRQRYVIVYTPRGVPQAGWHDIAVSVKRRGVTVRARPGYSR